MITNSKWLLILNFSFRRIFKAVDQLNNLQLLLANTFFTNTVLQAKDNKGIIRVYATVFVVKVS